MLDANKEEEKALVKKFQQILLGNLLVSVFLLGSFTNANAITFEWEHITGYMSSPPYGWTYSYDIGFYDNTLKIDVDIKLTGFDPGLPLTNRWASGIESIWSTTRFSIPISFNVDWVTSGYDHLVNVVNGTGRWNILNWYTVGAYGWGEEYQEEIAAHEFGHMVSMWDEYEGGAVNPNSPSNNTGGLMETLNGPTLNYYYAPFLDWYHGKMASAEPVPEPTTIVLFGIGIAVLAGTRRRRKE